MLEFNRFNLSLCSNEIELFNFLDTNLIEYVLIEDIVTIISIESILVNEMLNIFEELNIVVELSQSDIEMLAEAYDF